MSRPAAGRRPLDRDELSAMMAPLGPFEPNPHIAVAVSGGADSLALALLLNEWAAARGGVCTALIVDHGLRPESRREARRTAATLKAQGVAARILVWRETKPAANVQAAARAARYGLMSDWCRNRGVLHLAVAHHLEDQAETLLLRLGRGSGLDGLAAMAPVSELAHLRLLRPLLGVPKARLVATLAARGVDWIEDPSNQDRRSARIRLRQLAPDLAREGLTPARLAATAGRLGRAREALEQGLAALLARSVALDPAGFAWLDAEALGRAPREQGLRALARLLATIGGGAFGPRLERLEGLYGRITSGDFRGATLGGCRLQLRQAGVLVVREAAKIVPVEVWPGDRLLWDGRFEISFPRASCRPRRPLVLAPLGHEGWRHLRASGQAIEKTRFPSPARLALPALWEAGAPVCVPHLDFTMTPRWAGSLENCHFRPKNGLIGTWFRVA